MAIYPLIATCTFGMESLAAKEMKALGYRDCATENGRILFNGTEKDIAACNLWLRVADRILIRLADFEARSFDELFEGTKQVPWGEWIPKNGKIHVVGKSVQSILHGVPACQSIVKKSIVEELKKKYKTDWFSEDGPVYKIEVALLKDHVTLTLDTTGQGLNKRGYRKEGGLAPLRETLSSGLVMLSNWKAEKPLADPFCGSGTIGIEAALIAKNIAPGLNRSFVSQHWSQMPHKVWADAKAEAESQIRSVETDIRCSDIDEGALEIARHNAERAGVEKNIVFEQKSFEQFTSKKSGGCIITNPPYGERIGEMPKVEAMIRTMGSVFSRLDHWSIFVISPHPEFEKLYGKKANKNRKLFNGNIKCYYYQYLAS